MNRQNPLYGVCCCTAQHPVRGLLLHCTQQQQLLACLVLEQAVLRFQQVQLFHLRGHQCLQLEDLSAVVVFGHCAAACEALPTGLLCCSQPTQGFPLLSAPLLLQGLTHRKSLPATEPPGFSWPSSSLGHNQPNPACQHQRGLPRPPLPCRKGHQPQCRQPADRGHALVVQCYRATCGPVHSPIQFQVAMRRCGTCQARPQYTVSGTRRPPLSMFSRVTMLLLRRAPTRYQKGLWAGPQCNQRSRTNIAAPNHHSNPTRVAPTGVTA